METHHLCSCLLFCLLANGNSAIEIRQCGKFADKIWTASAAVYDFEESIWLMVKLQRPEIQFLKFDVSTLNFAVVKTVKLSDIITLRFAGVADKNGHIYFFIQSPSNTLFVYRVTTAKNLVEFLGKRAIKKGKINLSVAMEMDGEILVFGAVESKVEVRPASGFELEHHDYILKYDLSTTDFDVAFEITRGQIVGATGMWDGKFIYIFGGGGNYFSKRISRYNPVTSEFETLHAELLREIRTISTILLGKYALVIGYTSSDDPTIFVFDIEAQSVSELNVQHLTRFGTYASAVYVEKEEQIYIFPSLSSNWSEALCLKIIPPKFIDGVKDNVTSVGMNATITCPIFGDPTPRYSWERYYEDILPGDKYQVFENGVLAISSVELEDAGAYTCLASTQIGNLSKTANLVIEGTCSLVSDEYGTQWTGANTVKQTCGDFAEGFATWKCLGNGSFEGPMPNYDGCSSNWIGRVEDEIERDKNLSIKEASHLINVTLTNTEHSHDGEKIKYYGHELERVFKIGPNILKQLDQAAETETVTNLTKRVISIYQNLMLNVKPWEQLDDRNRSSIGTDFIKGIEESAFELTARVAVTNTSEDYSVNFERFHGMRVTAGILTSRDTSSIFSASTDDDAFGKMTSVIELPQNEAATQFVVIQINPVFMSNIFHPTSNDLDRERSVDYRQTILNGDVVSFSLNASNTINATGKHIRITFFHKSVTHTDLTPCGKEKEILDSPACVYWEAQNLSWSSNGCLRVSSNITHTVCECNHLTAFAILADVHKHLKKDLGLEILTWGLCLPSIFCLTLSVGIYFTPAMKVIQKSGTGNPAVRSWNGFRRVITMNLSSSLIVGNLLILLLLDRSYFCLNDVICEISGIVIHYAFLCAFAWMGFEGFSLYQKVSSIDEKTLKVKWAYIIAYAAPLVIVFLTKISSFVQHKSAYGNDRYCWLQGSYIWAFMGPVSAIFLVNLILLIIALRIAYKFQTPNSMLNITRRKKSTMTWIKKSLALVTLLGLTWGSGFLMIIDHPLLARIAAYIFTILNASQGIFLFVFNLNLARELLKYLPNKAKKKQGYESLNTANGKPHESFPRRVLNWLMALRIFWKWNETNQSSPQGNQQNTTQTDVTTETNSEYSSHYELKES